MRPLIMMRRTAYCTLQSQTILFCLLAFLFPSIALSQPQLQILSPTSGSCVPNVTSVPGGQPGFPVEINPSPVPISLLITEPNGDPVTVSATLNGQSISLNLDTLIIDLVNQPVEINVLEIAPELIVDGFNHVLSITVASVTSPTASVTESVTFDLDRVPPNITFTQAELDLLNSCDPNALATIETINPSVVDDFDPSPTLQSSTTSTDCSVTRTLIASDHCGEEGNSLILFFGISTPYTGSPEIMFEGIEEGGAYLEAYPSFDVSEGQECFDLEGEITLDGSEPDVAINHYLIDTPGEYQLTVNATDCTGAGPSDSVNFTILNPPQAIIAQATYHLTQGESIILDGSPSTCPPQLGGIVEYAWDFNLDNPLTTYSRLGETIEFNTYNPQTGYSIDDGVYRVGLRIITEQGQIEYTETEVTVEDAVPTCDAGGPYQVVQGEELTFDGSESAPGVGSEPIILYRWVFDDTGVFGSEQFGPGIITPTYIFHDEGIYEVELTVMDLDLSSCSSTAIVTVTDVDPEVSGLKIVTNPPYIEGQPITFNAGTTQAGGTGVEPIISFVWAWGDGSPDSVSAPSTELRQPTHSFINSGSFNVCLTVNDGDSSSQGCLPITIEDLSPRVRFSGDLFAIEGQEAHFSIAGTQAGGPTDPLDRVEIDWGDGMVDVFTGAELQNTDLIHRFEADGDLMIQVRAYDEDSFSQTIWELYVDDVSPHVAFQVVGVAEEGVSVTLNATASTPGAPSDPITSYTWDFGDGTSISGGPERSVVEHTWPDDGIYSVRLTLGDSDEEAANSLEQFVTVQNRAPYQASITTASRVVDLGIPVRFEVHYEDVLDDTVSVYWRMGEGTEYFNQNVVSHRYQELGVYTVRVELSDEDGGVTLLSYEVEVTPAGPQLAIEAPGEVREGDTLSLIATIIPAVTGDGGFDGPAELRVLRAPEGMYWEAIEPEGSHQRYRFIWPTSAGDSGSHILRILAVAPSGIERANEVTIEVTEALEASLLSLGGSSDLALLSLFKYERDLSRSLTTLSEQARVDIGRGIGEMTLHPDQADYLFVSAPTSGHVAVVSLSEGRMLRKIPIRGNPYALVSSRGYVWVFDARGGRISVIDSRLKVSRQLIIEGLAGVRSVVAYESDEEEAYLIAHDHHGGLWVLDQEAILSNQATRAVVQAHDLNLNLDAWERQARGETSTVEEELVRSVERRGAGGLIWHTSLGQLLVAHARGVVAFHPHDLLDHQPDPVWSLKSAAHLRSVMIYEGALWGTSDQGLRRFTLPESGLVEGAQGVGEVLDLNGQQTLAIGPERLLGEPTLIVGGARSLQHLSADSLRPILNRAEPNPQHLLFLLR